MSSFKENEKMLRAAFDVLAVAGDIPVLLVGDGNVEPAESPTIKEKLDALL